MNYKNSFKAIIFDFDGTMVDSESTTFKIAMPIISRYLGREVKDSEMDALKGKVWKQEFRTLFPEVHGDMYSEIVQTWEALDPDVKPYSGINSLLSSIWLEEIPMAIVSSRESRLVKETLKKLSWQDYFSSVVGQEDTDRHKPDAEPLLKVAEVLGVQPESCVYIGDQVWDIRASKAAGMASGAALWGEGIREILNLEQPDYIFDKPSDVLRDLFRRDLLP